VTTADAEPAFIEAFVEGLRDLGYVEGTCIVIEWRFAQQGAAWRALKPGGRLLMPLLMRPPEPGALREDAGRRYSKARVLYGGWGIPVVTAEELRAETETARFEYVRASTTAGVRVLLMRRPEA
jgi:hypothetical protein